MNKQLIKEKFNAIGSDVEFENGILRGNVPITVDVNTDKKGNEKFKISVEDENIKINILDVQPKDRHLLLMVKTPVENRLGIPMFWNKYKILCGHDERHYFSAGIPEASGASNVKEAKEALLPEEFIKLHKKKGRKKNRLNRRNEVGQRQGEWIFIKSNFEPPDDAIIRTNEPISRGGGSKDHICEEVVSVGGNTVWVNNHLAPNGVSTKEKEELEKIHGKYYNFQQRTIDAKVYARGYVRHSDHKTIILPGWHRVLMNRENESNASKISVFLD